MSALRHIPIRECGEPLVEFLGLSDRLVQDAPRFAYRRVAYARARVAEGLRIAAEALPPGFLLGVIEGWRSPHIQRRMHLTTRQRLMEMHPDWSPYRLARVANQFTAPMDRRVPPPHTTGGAVDVTLLDLEGRMVDVHSPYERRDRAGFFFDAPDLSPEARRHRAILAEAMRAGGLTNYPSEYWHWSYGDQGWAYRCGHPFALYGPVTPEGYEVPAEEVEDVPLEWVAG